jgi:hypothetical protein
MADNSGKSVVDLRIRKLNVLAPPALTQLYFQQDIINQGINLRSACSDMGDGSFNWILRLDKGQNTLEMGGSPPVVDPFGVGYCFMNMTANGITVAPVTANASTSPDGNWQTDATDKLYLSTYIQGPGLDIPDAADSTNSNNLLILPIHMLRMRSVSLTPDGNCVGSYTTDPSTCQRWRTAGTLGGYVTLEEADGITVPLTLTSLCVLLTNNTPPADSKHCARTDGGIAALGDFCSLTNRPASDPQSVAITCADSYWFAATFAASAAKIGDGSTVPQCNGTMRALDAGAGSGSDSGVSSDALGD